MAEQPAKGMRCIECKDVYPISLSNYSQCHFAPLELVYNPASGNLRERIEHGPNSLFRYQDFLPTSTQPDYNVGMTTLVRTDELAQALGFQKGKLYVKVDQGSISDTFKDRGVAVAAELIVNANRNGSHYKALGGTSTGNLMKAIAAAARKYNLKSVVVVHESVNDKLVQDAISLGSYVLKVDSNYSRANDLTKMITSNNPEISSRIAFINIDLRPLYGEGSKTIGFEIAEQLGWMAPQNIVHPCAAGLSSFKIYHGLREFEQFGIIQNVKTKMHIVQTAACDPIVQAWASGEPFEVSPVENPGKSLAETLCVSNPSNGIDVLKMLKESNGSAVSVKEDEILEGMELVKQTTNFRTDPVGGAVIAGAKRLVGKSINPDELTVVVLTDSYYPNKIHSYESSTGKRGRLIELEPKKILLQGALEDILGFAV